MGTEVEAKYTVDVSKLPELRKGTQVVQGYLPIKGPNQGITRPEYEFEIPAGEALQMLDTMCEKVVSKERHNIEFEGNTWEVDFFNGENEGLVLAEIELEDENAVYQLPEWTDKNVSDDKKYYNSNLIDNPFCAWEL
jgi:CYTH domain-containing protein